MNETLIRIVGKSSASILLFAGFWLASVIVRRLILRIGKRMDEQQGIMIGICSQVAHISLMMFGVITALGTLGINVSALVAGLGLTGFALGFAFKDALSNFLAGLLILFYRPFRFRDHISVAGLEGTVINIDLRYTTLEGEGKTYLIPNSTLFTNPITMTHRPGKIT